MTRKQAKREVDSLDYYLQNHTDDYGEESHTAMMMAVKALEQDPIDKSAMMYEIYMEGVNMTGEYHGCWVRFKDIEKIVDKYIKGGD